MNTPTPAEIVRAVKKAPREWGVVRLRDLENERLLAALREQQRDDDARRAECRAAWLITALTALALALIAAATLIQL